MSWLAYDLFGFRKRRILYNCSCSTQVTIDTLEALNCQKNFTYKTFVDQFNGTVFDVHGPDLFITVSHL